MQGTCTKCQRLYDNQMICPNCGIQLSPDYDSHRAMSIVHQEGSGNLMLSDGRNSLERWGIMLAGIAGGMLVVYHLIGVRSTPKFPDVFVQHNFLLAIVSTLIGAFLIGLDNRRAILSGAIIGIVVATGVVASDYFYSRINIPKTILVFCSAILCGITTALYAKWLFPAAPQLDRKVAQLSNTNSATGNSFPTIRLFVAAFLVVLLQIFSEKILIEFLRWGGSAGGRSPLLIGLSGAIFCIVGGIVLGLKTQNAGMVAGVGAMLVTLVLLGMGYSTAGKMVPPVEVWKVQLEDFNQALIGFSIANFLAIYLGTMLGSQMMAAPKQEELSEQR
ncbi:MAG: hypothetical protein R3B84_08485 [Zavarzinella sp.]